MYIRTKDGRILDFDKLNEVSKLSIDMEEEPIREAKTIEELCDEFVGYVGEEYVKENETYGIPNFQEYDLKDMLYHMSYNKEDCVVYGAIWTNKGLIYVAKMNDKGDLELI